MKKILSIVLAVAMVLGISFVAVPTQPALAASNAAISVEGSHRIGDTITLSITAPNAGKGETWDAAFSVDNSGLVDPTTISPITGMNAGNSDTASCKAKAAGTVKFTVTFNTFWVLIHFEGFFFF